MAELAPHLQRLEREPQLLGLVRRLRRGRKELC
jgi:hypothetical protein